MKKYSKAYNFAQYLYDKYATHTDGVYFNEDFSFEDAKKYYDYTISKKQYETAINWLNELDLPLYKGFLELSKNHTFWKLNTEKSDDEINFLLNCKFEEFKEKSGVEIFSLGRSGRHICVENSFENVINYHQLKGLQEELEEEFVAEANCLVISDTSSLDDVISNATQRSNEQKDADETLDVDYIK